MASFGYPRLITEHLESVTSTNDYLKQFVDRGQWRRVSAGHQTSGRGRYGRRWHSEQGAGLYVSFLLFPEIELDETPGLLEIGCLAVVACLAKVTPTLDLRVKEPNDVLAAGRKIAGILTELGTTGQRLNWVILGIGINVNHAGFPAELEGRATSLALEGVDRSDPVLMCDSLTDELLARLAMLCDGHRPTLQRHYRRLLSEPE